MNNKGFTPVIMIIIVIILFGGIGVWYYFNQSSLVSPKVPASSIPTASPEAAESTPIPLGTGNDVNKQILQDIVGNGITCDLVDASGAKVSDACKVDKVAGNYAKGTMPMAYWMAQKTNNKWSVVVTGNGIPACKDIDVYSIPKEIFGNCIEASGQLRY